jgi:hypothetical protein
MKKRNKRRIKQTYVSKTELPTFQLLKSKSCLLKDGKTYLIMAYLYISKKEGRGTAMHRWEGIIISKEDLENLLKDLETRFGDDWKWPGIDDFQIKYGGTPKCRVAHSWWKARMKEAQNWEDFYKGLNPLGKNRWPIDNYVLDDGTPFMIFNDEDLMLELVGRRFSRVQNNVEPKFTDMLLPKIN